ncbi:MAG: transcription termination factor NusA, partial [Rickettsiales bacterium]|nr:transcription termination factor NusA [Rickettsiales bacterium]
EMAARCKYGYENTIRATIGKGGDVTLVRELTVVEEQDVEDRNTQIALSDAKLKDPEVELGGIVTEPLPPIDLGRVAAQAAKQVIIQKVREAEKVRQYDEYKSREGEIVNGIVKRIDYGDIVVTLGHSSEAVIKRNSLIKGETFKVGDRVRAYLESVIRDNKGHQLFLSRTAPEFLAKLFAQEVPEVYDKIIDIVSVSREPGSRAKVAVLSHDSNIDPVGSCVGVRGARVNSIINELQGEKIDIIQYSAEPATFIVNALAPAEVSKVVIDEENNRIEVVVPDDQLSLAIGRRGQNVRLASRLANWSIDVMTEDDESKRRVEEFNTLSSVFIEALNVEDVIAHLLVTEGFTSIEEVAYVPVEEISEIEGFDEEVAAAIRERAREYLKEQQEKVKNAWKLSGVSEELLELPNMDQEMMVVLGEAGVKTLDDVADLSRDEFRDLLPDTKLDDDKINEIIMAAREHWFKNESQVAENS